MTFEWAADVVYPNIAALWILSFLGVTGRMSLQVLWALLSLRGITILRSTDLFPILRDMEVAFSNGLGSVVVTMKSARKQKFKAHTNIILRR